MTEPTYTFVSVSTAKPGRLDDLVDLASRPSEQMEGKVPGMLARQVGVDRDRNTVVVWVTFADRSDLYDHLATEAGQDDHGEGVDMTDVIDTFEMYDLTPVSGRLAATR
ncbi:putative quinol monooxygenase [Ilumatobacter sp.]|uniref:putative quinol monooxygenase n=1 Tax=Ilumatobacter sp. TaxID=1967498 RepID=UPI003AF7CBCE